MLNIDLTLPKAPCAILALDVVDVTGVHEVGIEGRLHKHSLDSDGKMIGVTDALKQKEEVRNPDVIFATAKKQLEDKEGCQLEGSVRLHKVPGNFHLSSHDCPETVMKLLQSGFKIDFTHTINHLSFGAHEDQYMINRRYGGEITNELGGKNVTQAIPFGQLLVNYYLDITEEEYTDTTYTVPVLDSVTQEQVNTTNPIFIGFPYRAMQQMMISNMLPTIIWNVSITPIKAHYTLFKESLADFLVRLCGIVGGIFAAATIFESILRNGLCLMVPDMTEEEDAPKKTKPVSANRVDVVEMVPQEDKSKV